MKQTPPFFLLLPPCRSRPLASPCHLPAIVTRVLFEVCFFSCGSVSRRPSARTPVRRFEAPHCAHTRAAQRPAPIPARALCHPLPLPTPPCLLFWSSGCGRGAVTTIVSSLGPERPGRSQARRGGRGACAICPIGEGGDSLTRRRGVGRLQAWVRCLPNPGRESPLAPPSRRRTEARRSPRPVRTGRLARSGLWRAAVARTCVGARGRGDKCQAGRLQGRGEGSLVRL